jgi:hypothetical protein
MKRRKLRALTLVLVLAAILAGVLVAQAQTGGGYDLTWNLVGGSGGAMSGDAYTLEGSAGQADAGTISGGSYTLNGGFWVSGELLLKRLYLPLALKDGS